VVRSPIRLGLPVAALLLACTAGCVGAPSSSGATEAAGPGTIGIAMPTREQQRWIADGENMAKQFQALGYGVDMQYADDNSQTQASQLDAMIDKGDRALVIGAVDGLTLAGALGKAHAKGIPVIAYDRLIRDSENVNYYATFDNFLVGQQQAWTVLNGLGLTDLQGEPLADAPEGPFNIELFAGSPDDNNATFFFNGAMSVLKPLIDNGTLVVKSGQTDFNTVAILRWDPATAQRRMEDIITSSYGGGATVQGVLSPYDGLSIGILSALKSNGYGTAAQPYPTVTGQDAEVASVKSIIAGEQFATIYKDTRQLADVTVKMADAVLKGGQPEVNNTTDYGNGVKVVPSYLLQPVVVYKDNYKKELVDSGYYTAAQLQ
jgi:putative multiple sugar transport system substrate-binding protein